MSETYPGFQPGGFQAALEGGGFQVALLVPTVPAAHWVPRAFHGAHWRVGHWIGEPTFVPPVVHRRHWVTRAFHATHWGQTHWAEGATAPPVVSEILGDAGFVLGADAEFTFRSGLGPRPPTSVWIPRRRRRARRAEIEADAGFVLGADADIVFRPAPLRRQTIPAEAGVVLQADADWRYLDYVADVLLPEEEELLALL